MSSGALPSQHSSLPDDLNDLWDEALRDEDQQADDDAEDPFGLGGNMDDDDDLPPTPPVSGRWLPRANPANPGTASAPAMITKPRERLPRPALAARLGPRPAPQRPPRLHLAHRPQS